MAMNLRLPAELDAQLEALAQRDHVSKHALVLQSVEQLVSMRARRTEIDSGMEFVLDHDADLLDRLADA